jgi:hypothetical protein
MSKGIKHNLLGQQFGRLTVLELFPTKAGPSKWKCICECGKETIVFASNLISGGSKSCGCLAREITSLRSTKHGKTNTTEFNIWHSIKLRCLNSNNKAYHNYGGRGIGMDQRWIDSFETFFDDMGFRPSKKHSIERRNNDLGYSKSNCYWGTSKEQTDNRRVTVWLEYNGIRLPQADWGRKLGINISSLAYHRKKGIPFNEIVEYYLINRNNTKNKEIPII